MPSTILKILRAHPDGLDIEQIREIGGIAGQQHLDKRIRELYPFYEIQRDKVGRKTIYRLIGERQEGEYEFGVISKTIRAKILHRDGRRCRMCGRTVDDDQIKLHIDHKVPRDWGGATAEENLWPLCSTCKDGKRNYFASFDPELMKHVFSHESVHLRLAEELRSKLGEWVDCDLLEFVANFDDYQTDWRKRLRELRYFGLEIETSREKRNRRAVSLYRLRNWAELPDDLSEAARRFEVVHAVRNRRSGED